MSKKFSLITLIAFAVSIVAGLVIPNICTSVAFLGTIYVNLLKVMIVPVLFTAIVNALLKGRKGTGKITVKTIVIFILMYVLSYLVCSGLWAVIKPGVGFSFEEVEWSGTLASTKFSDFMLSIFPDNIIAKMSTNTILPVILFAFVMGIAGSKLTDDKRAVVSTFFDGLNDIFTKMLTYIMYTTPIGVFALMGNIVAVYGAPILSKAAIYVGMAWLGCIVIAVLVMMVPVWVIAKVNPITYLKKVYKVWLITLSTCSSAATLPTTIRVCNEDFKVPAKITDIVVPLGCTIHMCGGAVSFSLLMMFSMQMYSIPMTFGLFLLGLFVSLLLNMGAPGIPGGGIVIGATFLSVLGVPLTFIGFYAGIYKLLDMPYTTMNVCGDISANILVDKLTDEKDC